MLNKELYIGTVEKVQKSKHELSNPFYIPLAYVVIISGLFVICFSFVDTQLQKYKNIDKRIVAFFAGGFYGVIVNSVYNFTSLVAYKDYSLLLTIVDMVWAHVLYGTASVLYVQL
jgi:uncharacterized membrane protein